MAPGFENKVVASCRVSDAEKGSSTEACDTIAGNSPVGKTAVLHRVSTEQLFLLNARL